VVLKQRALAQQALVCRQPAVRRQLAGAEVALLVGQDKEDVVWASGRLRARESRALISGRSQSGAGHSARDRACDERLQHGTAASIRNLFINRFHSFALLRFR